MGQPYTRIADPSPRTEALGGDDKLDFISCEKRAMQSPALVRELGLASFCEVRFLLHPNPFGKLDWVGRSQTPVPRTPPSRGPASVFENLSEVGTLLAPEYPSTQSIQ